MKRKGTTELSSAQPHSTQYSRRMSEADANLHGMCLMLFISSFRVACLCCLLKVLVCSLLSVWERRKAKRNEMKQTNRAQARRRKKHTHHQQQQQQHIARAINRIETSKIIRSASEFCLWEAKIESTRARLRMKRTHWAQARAQVKISNKTMPCHGYTMPKQLCQQIVFIIIN